MRSPTVSKNDCIQILLDLYKKFGRLTIPLIEENTSFTRRSVRTHFGSLANFKNKFNLKDKTFKRSSNKRKKKKIWTKSEVIIEAQRLVKIFGYFSKGLLERKGYINHKAVIRLYGSFNNFINENNLPRKPKHFNLSDEELLQSLQYLYKRKKKFSSEDINDYCVASLVTYYKRFGSIEAAAKLAGVPYYKKIYKKESFWINFVGLQLGCDPQLQKTFHWLRSPKNGAMRLDAWFPKFNLALEYNGRQHYMYTRKFHRSKKDYEYQCTRDESKRNLLKENNINLLEIHYEDNENIVLEKLNRILGLSA